MILPKRKGFLPGLPASLQGNSAIATLGVEVHLSCYLPSAQSVIAVIDLKGQE